MIHNKECPKCGTIGDWNRLPREKKIMPNGEEISYHPINGVKCPKCGLLFEPRSHDALRKKMKEVFG